MKKFSGIVTALLLFSLYNAPSVRSQSAALAFPQELEADLSAGATAIYNLQFDLARDRLDHAIQLRPDHPAAYFFKAMAKWYELTYDSLLNRDDRIEKDFEDLADKTISISKKFAKDPRLEAVAALYWGGGLGAKGWHYFSRRQWVKAYFSGKKGYGLLNRVLEKDPEMYDAYLGIGMYQYYAATLGPVLKALSAFLIRGDREQGMRDLHFAESRSRYVRLEAAYFLWNAAMDEGRLADAHEKLAFLNHAVPNSPLFLWCEIQTVFYEKKWDEVLAMSEEYIHWSHMSPRPEQYQNTFPLLLAKVYFHAGLAALNLKKLGEARSYFNRCIAQESDFEGWRTMAYLRRGELSDLEGNRAAAVEDYRKVLGRPDVWDSRSLTKERMRNPFRNGSSNHFVASPLQQWKKEIN